MILPRDPISIFLNIRSAKTEKRRQRNGENINNFSIILSWNYLSRFFWLKVYQIDLNLCFVPIFKDAPGNIFRY